MQFQGSGYALSAGNMVEQGINAQFQNQRKHCWHFALAHPIDENLQPQKEHVDVNQTMQKHVCRFCPRLRFLTWDGILGDT